MAQRGLAGGRQCRGTLPAVLGSDDRLALGRRSDRPRGSPSGRAGARCRMRHWRRLPKPILRRRTLTFWAMAVAARVVSDAAVAAVLAALDMAAERSRAALLDRRHHLELTQAHMPGIGAAPVGSMAMKDGCDLQLRAAHRRSAKPRVVASPRSMVRAGRVG
jgi:hypothetical protein